MEAGFNYKGILQLQKQLLRMEKGFSAWMQEFLLDTAQEALEQLRRDTPADIEGLREGWKIGSIKKSGGGISVTIVNGHEKAALTEYGGRNKDRTQWQEGSFICTLALNEMNRRLPARYRQEFGAWVRGLGGDVR